MRKLGAALLAIPVLAAFYLAWLTRQRGAGRLLAGIAAGAVIALVLVVSLPPAPGAAVPPSAPGPVSANLLDAVRTGHSLIEPVEITFDAPMDAASVAGALRLSPDAAVSLSWDAAGRRLTIAPASHWHPDTLYTMTIDASARSERGGRLETPVRALVLTTTAGTGSIAATRPSGGRIRPDTAFRIHLDRAVSLAAVRSALRSTPAVQGDVVAGASDGDYLFTPTSPLSPGTSYRVWLDGLADADGIPFATLPSVEASTVGASSVVRFRPRNGSGDVDRAALLSVRFTEAMNRRLTAAAFRVTANGSPVTGTTGWAEGGTVLVFRPAAALAYGARVVMTVDASARSRAGALVPATASGTFTVAPKQRPAPVRAQAARTPSHPRKTPIPHSGGGGAVSGSWSSVESYYLRLMNCTRTGGWVTASGSCSSPGGRNVAALALSPAISSNVSRPYAKLLATRNLCDHFIGGTPGDRLRRAGYSSYRWGENLGCRSGNAYSAVLGSHRFFQSEKSYNGGHYRNLMNAEYDRVGIGVWVSGGRVRLVIDFYHP